MISSGDSGSGYVKPSCFSGGTAKKGVEVTEGTVLQSIDEDQAQCCSMAEQNGAKGWTWKAPPRPLSLAAHAAVGRNAKRFARRLTREQHSGA